MRVTPQIPTAKLARKQKVPNAELNAILTKLPDLSTVDLQEVKNKAAALLLMSGPGRCEKTPLRHTGWLKDGLIYVLRTRGLMRGDFLLIDGKQTHQLQETENELLAMIGREMTAAEKTALGRVAANALADRVSNYKPLSPRNLLQDIAHIVEALDGAFPGYLTAGMVGLLVRTP